MEKLVKTKVDAEALARIEGVVEECSITNLSAMGKLERALSLSWGIQQLRKLLTPEILAQFMVLQNTRLGFLTDKPEGYPPEIVQEAIIEGMIRGVFPILNRMNIIAAHCYITVEGFSDLLRTYPGLKDLECDFDIPHLAQAGVGAITDCKASWRLDGKRMRMSCPIPVRVNKLMGVDAILGKTERKLKARVYKRITGTELSDGSVDDLAPADVKVLEEEKAEKSKTARMKKKLGVGKENGEPEKKEEPKGSYTLQVSGPGQAMEEHYDYLTGSHFEEDGKGGFVHADLSLPQAHLMKKTISALIPKAEITLTRNGETNFE